MEKRFTEILFDRKTKNKHSRSFGNIHFHPYHELYYIVSGKAKYFIGSDLFVLNQGDFIFIPRNEYHKTEYISAKPTDRILLFFNDEFVGEDFSKHLEMLKQTKHFQIENEHAHELRSILRSIEEEGASKQDDYAEMQRMYLRQLIVKLGRYGHKGNQDFNATYTMIQDAAKYISSNYEKDLNLTDISRMYSLSTTHFGTQFKKVMGVGFKEYLTITRISAAKAMFKSGEKCVSKVAYSCGFNDSNYFIQVFKGIVGITPKKYSTKA